VTGPTIGLLALDEHKVMHDKLITFLHSVVAKFDSRFCN